MPYQTFLHHVEALREAGFALSLDPQGAIRFFLKGCTKMTFDPLRAASNLAAQASCAR
jgi:hypothetical protein